MLLPELAISGEQKESAASDKVQAAEVQMSVTEMQSPGRVSDSDEALDAVAASVTDDESSKESMADGRASILSGELVELIPIPRWIVYLQGALLGVIATSFFVFGFAVGNHTKSLSQQSAEPGRCQVQGTVYFDEGTYRRADYGAVVLLLPAERKPRQRPDASGLRPGSFEPLDNPSIEAIRELGGAVVRANTDGAFQATLEADKSYWVLAISKNKQLPDAEISKQTRAEIGAYFFPIEDLFQDQAFSWTQVRVTGQSQTLDAVVF